MNRLPSCPPTPAARALLLSGLLPALLWLPTAHADERNQTVPAPPASPASPASTWSLGLGAAYQQRLYRETEEKPGVLPFVSYESRWLRWQVLSADLRLLPDGPVDLALRARYEPSGYEASDSPALAGMEERKSGLWAGAALQWRTFITLGLEVVADASGYSNGIQAKLSLAKDFRLGRLGLTPRVAVTWMDTKYVDHYYGVAAAEALATRPAYAGEATANAELGLRAGYGLTRSQALFVDLSATQLGQAIQDSPLVDASTQGGIRLGYVHRF